MRKDGRGQRPGGGGGRRDGGGRAGDGTAKGGRPGGRGDREASRAAGEGRAAHRAPTSRFHPDGSRKSSPAAWRKPYAGAAAPTPQEAGHPIGTMRIAKAMARAGLCSRREAERWIADGRVSVNGKVLATPAVEVGPRDRVLVDGSPLPEAEPVRLWRYHKPRGLVTTHKDPEDRPTVFDNLPPGLPRVISIGRLDYNTEGLLLLTTDGALARHLELPATGWLRRYRVRARGRVTQAALDGLKDGVTIEGVHYGPIEATLDSEKGANVWLTIGLREGKNREIRKILGHLDLEVGRLIRVSFGPFQLLELEPGQAEPVKRRVLAEQLGARLARELGVVAGTEPQAKPKPGRGSRAGRARPRDEDRRAGEDGSEGEDA